MLKSSIDSIAIVPTLNPHLKLNSKPLAKSRETMSLDLKLMVIEHPKCMRRV